MHNSSFQEGQNSVGDCAATATAGRGTQVRFMMRHWAMVMTDKNSKSACFVLCISQKQTENLRSLYCAYLKKEMENRDQEMAYRALKMRKLEKEILLLDKQLM